MEVPEVGLTEEVRHRQPAHRQLVYDVRRKLILVESAVEGADMGNVELRDVISCKLLEIIDALEPIA